MRSKTIFPAIGLALLLSSLGFAQEPSTKIEWVNRLKEVIKDCDWQARNLTGAPKGRMLLHKRTMEDVLEQLKSGREVDAKNICRSFQGPSDLTL